jgi:hypothetical protein
MAKLSSGMAVYLALNVLLFHLFSNVPQNIVSCGTDLHTRPCYVLQSIRFPQALKDTGRNVVPCLAWPQHVTHMLRISI